MSETIKGIFINNLLHQIDERGDNDLKKEISEKLGKPLKYSDFFDYPVTEFTLMQEDVVKKFFPDKSFDEGLNMLGRDDFDLFARSTLGKAVLPYVKKDLKSMSTLIPQWYKLVSKFGKITSEELGEKKFKLIFKDYKTYPQTEHGFLQEALSKLGYKGEVKINIIKLDKKGPGDILTDFECIAEWE